MAKQTNESMLERKVNDMTRIMVVSDLHGEFHDARAVDVAVRYMREYKPEQLIIAGDLVDFYGLSRYDQNPERKFNIQGELDTAKELLGTFRDACPKAKIVYLKGNHEGRLQKFLWKNPEVHQLEALKLDQLLDTKTYRVNYVDTKEDYWKADSGHYKVGDLLVMHGDNRLNGASLSANSGASAVNTMKRMNHGVVLGHNHRLAAVYQTTPNGVLVSMETGCLCLPTGTSNWQQGFVTFDVEKGKTYNHRVHRIEDGSLVEGNKRYTSRKKNREI